MTEAELPHASDKDTYIRTVEDANRRWKSTADALDSQFALRLARPDKDQSPAALHSQYLHKREGERRGWQSAVSAATADYCARTGESTPPRVGWTPGVPEPLPAPGQSSTGPGQQFTGARKQRTGLRWLMLAVAVTALILVGVALSTTNKPSPDSSAGSTSGTSAYSSTVQVLYEVEGTAKGVDVTLEAETGTSQLNDKAVPLANKTTGKKGLTYSMSRGHFVYLSAQNQGSSGTITCRITVDGTVVSTNTSSGGYAIASCKGTAR
jgi:hypothetical protein